MSFHRAGREVALDRAALAAAFADRTPRIAVLVHGVMCTETIWRFADGSDFGERLRHDTGISPLSLRYNSGLPIADNGAALADCLQRLLEAYPQPVEELILVGYSMGGLVVRSACHVAATTGQPWLSRVSRAVYVGAPHAGAPAERAGRLVTSLLRAIPDPYTRLVGELADLRSAGIRDLGHADLRHEDRKPGPRLSIRDARHPVPLLPDIDHALVAGSVSLDPRLAALFGDSIVPLHSATARGMLESGELALAAEHVRIVPGVNHLDLPHHEDVYAFVRDFCKEPRCAT